MAQGTSRPMEDSAFKLCPFCKEQIRKEAIGCRFCVEWLEQTEPDPIAGLIRWSLAARAFIQSGARRVSRLGNQKPKGASSTKLRKGNVVR
jgi:hypothetical protein